MECHFRPPDVTYDPIFVSVPGEGPRPETIVFSPTYPNAQSGDTRVPGLVDEVGAFDGINVIGGGEFLLWSLTFSANAEGLVSFAANPHDLSPQHDALLFGVNFPIDPANIDYGSASLTIGIPEPGAFAICSNLGLTSVARRRRRRRT